MNKVYNHFSSILLGLFVGFMFLYSIEALGHYFYPLPEKLTSNLNSDINILSKYINSVPKTAMLFPLASFIISSFSGGFISNLLSKRVYTSVIVGGIILTLNTINLQIITHPLWFQVTSSIIPLPFSLLGGSIAKQYFISK